MSPCRTSTAVSLASRMRTPRYVAKRCSTPAIHTTPMQPVKRRPASGISARASMTDAAQPKSVLCIQV